ncbi:hypothetical protein [Polyangium sp. 6x1]|uniref:hypothetical protein n=1 Tax=Polyangium sp. 6x1 TaxID=3042689 RepID=UPI002482B4DC|nr:hypothetical protein [Polyangium sp. 6x1]MDI1449334.1 hypothetical protein [Polyangium sp. 6x1]
MRLQRWGDVVPTAAPAPPPVGLVLRSARSAPARLVWLGGRLVRVARGVLGLPARRARLGLARLVLRELFRVPLGLAGLDPARLDVRLVRLVRVVLGLPARRAPLLARLGLARLAASLGRPDRRARLGLARKLPSVGRPDLESIEGMLVLAPPIAFEP